MACREDLLNGAANNLFGMAEPIHGCRIDPVQAAFESVADGGGGILSSCGPHPNAHPPPPIAQAPTPIRVNCMSLLPRVFVSIGTSGARGLSMYIFERPSQKRIAINSISADRGRSCSVEARCSGTRHGLVRRLDRHATDDEVNPLCRAEQFDGDDRSISVTISRNLALPSSPSTRGLLCRRMWGHYRHLMDGPGLCSRPGGLRRSRARS